MLERAAAAGAKAALAEMDWMQKGVKGAGSQWIPPKTTMPRNGTRPSGAAPQPNSWLCKYNDCSFAQRGKLTIGLQHCFQCNRPKAQAMSPPAHSLVAWQARKQQQQLKQMGQTKASYAEAAKSQPKGPQGKPSKENTTDSEGFKDPRAGQEQSTEAAETETLLPKKWRTDLEPHFTKLTGPPTAQAKEKMTVDEFLATKMPKTSTQAAQVKKLELEIRQLKQTVQTVPDVAKEPLQIKLEKLEKELAALATTKDCDTETLREIVALKKAEQDLVLKIGEKGAKLAKHTANKAQCAQEFRNAIEEHRTRLNHLEQLYLAEAAQKTEEWAVFNKGHDAYSTELLKAVQDRIAKCPQEDSPPPRSPLIRAWHQRHRQRRTKP